jgi:flagellar hook assembly protein FlgD
VELKIYDISGREIATLVSENLAPGEYHLQWNGKDDFGNPLSSGVYFYRLSSSPLRRGARGDVQTRKMILMK